jgi:hypothetical protein
MAFELLHITPHEPSRSYRPARLAPRCELLVSFDRRRSFTPPEQPAQERPTRQRGRFTRWRNRRLDLDIDNTMTRYRLF